MSKAIARAPRKAQRAERRADGRSADLRARPEGRHGKTLTSCNLAVALALAGQKVLVIDLDLQFGDVALCLGLSPREDDVRPRDLRRLARRGQARRLRDDARHGRRRAARAGTARPGERDHDRAPPRRPRRRARRLRLRHRRHPAGLHRRGDRDDRRELRPRHGRHARLALAQEHEARARDARADGLRPEEDPARPQPGRHARRASASTTSSPCSGSEPERLHPVRPRDPALGERGHPDHPVAAAVVRGGVVPRPRRDSSPAVPRRQRAARPSAASSERGQSRSLFRFRRK